MTPKQRRIALVVAVLAALWAMFFFSGTGLLVWSDRPDGNKVGMLKCQYFTGGGFIEKQFLYSDQGFLGRQACPRTIELE